MEEIQRELIRSRKAELIRTLTVNTMFLAHLEEKKILSEEDVQQIVRLKIKYARHKKLSNYNLRHHQFN